MKRSQKIASEADEDFPGNLLRGRKALTCSVSMSHKTTSWKSRTSICRWQAGRLSCRAGGKNRPWSRIDLNLLPQRLEHEEGVGHHHQGQMPMQAIPTTALNVIEATFAFGILIELLDRPAQMRQFDQARQGGCHTKFCVIVHSRKARKPGLD